MKRLSVATVLWPVLGALLVLLAAARVAHAHESRMVGPYEFVVGFADEPAFEGQANGVQLRVSRAEGEEAEPVEGLEQTLQVEVTHVESGVSEVMDLRAVFGDAGHYTNDWIPSAPGQYRFRFFGDVEDLAVDEVFESGPDTFSSVEPAGDLYFPEPVPAARELEGGVRGAQSAADEALGTALDLQAQLSTLRTLALAAIGLAIAAIIVGAVAFLAARRS
ncbi:MAG: hypothetical protein ACOC9X_06625 [bacterium]